MARVLILDHDYAAYLRGQDLQDFGAMVWALHSVGIDTYCIRDLHRPQIQPADTMCHRHYKGFITPYKHGNNIPAAIKAVGIPPSDCWILASTNRALMDCRKAGILAHRIVSGADTQLNWQQLPMGWHKLVDLKAGIMPPCD